MAWARSDQVPTSTLAVGVIILSFQNDLRLNLQATLIYIYIHTYICNIQPQPIYCIYATRCSGPVMRLSKCWPDPDA